MKSIILVVVLLLGSGRLDAATASCRWVAPLVYVDGSLIAPGTSLMYTVYRAKRNDLADAMPIGVTDKLLFYDTTAARKIYYWYYVRAYVAVGKEGPESNVGRFYTSRP